MLFQPSKITSSHQIQNDQTFLKAVRQTARTKAKLNKDKKLIYEQDAEKEHLENSLFAI